MSKEDVIKQTELAEKNHVALFIFFLEKSSANNQNFRRTFYGVNVFKMREVVKLSDVKVSNIGVSSNSLISGLGVLRGEAISLINLFSWLGIKNEPLNQDNNVMVCEFNNQKIGILIAEPYRIETKSWAEIQPATFGNSMNYKFSNLTKINDSGELCLILDVEKLLSEIFQEQEANVVEDLLAMEEDLSELTQNKYVLVAEDSIIPTEHLKRMFAKTKIKGIFTKNGAEALQKIDEMGIDSFALVITDLEMPIISGQDLIQKIRKNLKSDIPIIVNSSMTSENNIREAKRLGADCFIGKTDLKNIVLNIKALLQ
jgi:chemotaxis signal transduction protein/ActR/RegA family two-component response regulator